MLDKAIKKISECGCGCPMPSDNGGQMSMGPGNLLSFLVKRNQAEEEETTPGTEDSPRNDFNTNVEEDTIENDNFRKVLFTTEKSQLVLMSLKPGEDIGMETHDGDQFFRFEKGEGKIIINGEETKVVDGSAAVVREGSEHNVVNTSETEDLKLYAIYSPPQHPDGTINATKPEGDEHE